MACKIGAWEGVLYTFVAYMGLVIAHKIASARHWAFDLVVD